MGDLNIDSSVSQDQGINAFHDFCDVFDLSNLIKGKTCMTKKHSSSIDVILTNKKQLFKNIGTIETGVSDFYKMALTMLRVHFKKLKPIQITYHDYQNLDQAQFLEDLRDVPFHLCEALANLDPSLIHDLLVKIFTEKVDKHAPLRKRHLRGNQVPFITKEYSKAIMTISCLCHRYNKTKTSKNLTGLKAYIKCIEKLE